jgi:penicillin-binding protein 2
VFERRLTILLWIAVLAAAGLVARLFQLQIVQGGHYRELSESAVERPPETLWPLRGRILDRRGTVLVADEPAYDATIHYGVLSMDDDFLRGLARRVIRELPPDVPRGERVAEAGRRVRERIAEMWIRLSRASGVSTADLCRRRDEICRRVESLRRHLWAARGAEGSADDLRLAEDEMRHAILRDVTPEVRARIELELGDVPWLRIEPSVRRASPPGRAAAHVSHLLGRLSEVSAGQMDRDPFRADERRRYLPGELVGTSGVERAAETILRGVRGMRQRDLDGRVIIQDDPRDGRDVALTIDLDLQRRIEDVLAESVAAHPPSTGAACVVIDVRSRDVLALVSVPVFDPRELGTRYAEWRDDTRTRPLLFRAVAEEYPPGSIIKPLALLAGLSSGAVDPRARIECRGRLFEGIDAWFCWTQWRDLPPHGPVDAVEALQHSCNIYFYQLGQKVGAAGLTDVYRQIVKGRGNGEQGTGLVEARGGLIPTEEEIRQRRGRGFDAADGRNYALGQGEVQITPLQAANLYATIATGAYREPRLIRKEGPDHPAAPPSIPAEVWAIVREGLYRCVNLPGGTAHEGARMEELTVCGKTGSAEAVPRVLTWRFRFQTPDGQQPEVIAPTIEQARDRLHAAADWTVVERKPVERWPAVEPGRGKRPTHAWFAGYAPREDPQVAVALVIEYGGSGGKVAAPVGRRIFEALLDSDGGYLRRDAASRGRPRRPHVEPEQESE